MNTLKDVNFDGDIVEDGELHEVVFLHDPAFEFLTGLDAFYRDNADAVAVLMDQKLYGHPLPPLGELEVVLDS